MKNVETPSWNAVLLVCRQCAKRSNGPATLDAKEVAGELRRSARAERPRPRVLLSTCLGMCPRKAVAVARVGGPDATRMVAVESLKQARRALPTPTP